MNFLCVQKPPISSSSITASAAGGIGEGAGETYMLHNYTSNFFSCVTAMDIAREELKKLISQRLHILSRQLRLLDSVGHGTPMYLATKVQPL